MDTLILQEIRGLSRGSYLSSKNTCDMLPRNFGRYVAHSGVTFFRFRNAARTGARFDEFLDGLDVRMSMRFRLTIAWQECLA